MRYFCRFFLFAKVARNGETGKKSGLRLVKEPEANSPCLSLVSYNKWNLLPKIGKYPTIKFHGLKHNVASPETQRHVCGNATLCFLKHNVTPTIVHYRT